MTSPGSSVNKDFQGMNTGVGSHFPSPEVVHPGFGALKPPVHTTSLPLSHQGSPNDRSKTHIIFVSEAHLWVIIMTIAMSHEKPGWLMPFCAASNVCGIMWWATVYLSPDQGIWTRFTPASWKGRRVSAFAEQQTMSHHTKKVCWMVGIFNNILKLENLRSKNQAEQPL